jgi:hypothetical protein
VVVVGMAALVAVDDWLFGPHTNHRLVAQANADVASESSRLAALNVGGSKGTVLDVARKCLSLDRDGELQVPSAAIDWIPPSTTAPTALNELATQMATLGYTQVPKIPPLMFVSGSSIVDPRFRWMYFRKAVGNRELDVAVIQLLPGFAEKGWRQNEVILTVESEPDGCS